MTDFTKKAIQESFVKLLNEKPLSEITVKLISKDCGINRNTFYYHYPDTPTLLEEIVLDQFNKILSAYPAIDSLEEGLLAVLEFINKNKKAVGHIYNSVSWNLFENYLFKLTDRIARQYSETILEGRKISEQDKNLAVISIRAIIIGFTLDWLNSGMKSDLEDDIKRICQVSRGTIVGILDRIDNSMQGEL